MTTKEYLEQYREDIPEWLKVYQSGQSRSLVDFLQSRVVYYPGSGIDGDPVEVFGASHSAHCFVYADYWLSEDDIKLELHTRGFKGYNILDEVSFSIHEVMSAIPRRESFLTPDELRAAAAGVAERRRTIHPDPYALLAILERKSGFDDDHGPERFAVLFLGADGFATYEALFANKNAPKFFGLVVQDHGFGGNYDHFGRGGLLEKIMVRSGAYPHFILTEYPRSYDGYANVEWTVPVGSRRRSLFYREDMGCQPPKDEEEERPVHVPKMSAEEFFDIHT